MSRREEFRLFKIRNRREFGGGLGSDYAVKGSREILHAGIIGSGPGRFL